MPVVRTFDCLELFVQIVSRLKPASSQKPALVAPAFIRIRALSPISANGLCSGLQTALGRPDIRGSCRLPNRSRASASAMAGRGEPMEIYFEWTANRRENVHFAVGVPR